jgi:predicted alpha/beta-fold hydrolase
LKYRPAALLRNGHFNTIYPVLFRGQNVPAYERVRYETPDEDFFDVDFQKAGNKRIAIICHGLEGSSRSKYVIGTSTLLHQNAWDVAAINHRSCSGEINRTQRMYHSGATWDLDFLIDILLPHYEEISLVGFSLGGNMVLKYSGEQSNNLDEKIRSIVAVSVPMDLRAGSIQIGRRSNYIYEKKFLITLLKKMKIKARQFPELIDEYSIPSCRSMYDFDERYTAPLHGFVNADDYYAKSSSKFFVEFIQRPALIINALDDPFLPEECYPESIVAQNPYCSLEIPKYGGHVGFVEWRQKYYWEEKRILAFLSEHSRLQAF